MDIKEIWYLHFVKVITTIHELNTHQSNSFLTSRFTKTLLENYTVVANPSETVFYSSVFSQLLNLQLCNAEILLRTLPYLP